MRKLYSVLALSLLIFVLSGCMVQQSPENVSLINTTGTGKITTDPDTVEVKFSVATEGKGKNVQSDNAAKTQKVIEALVSAGLTKDETDTKNVNFYPLRRWDKEKGDQIIGYRAENSIVIKTTKTDKAGTFVDTAVENGAEMVGSLSFSLSDEGKEKLLDQAIEKAVGDARKQADAAAKAAGAQIVRVKRIDVQKNNEDGPVLYKQLRAAADEAVVQTPILPQDAEYAVMVQVSFEIE